MLLRKLGYEIVVAANGREALQLLESEARRGKQFEVECILMDASMVRLTEWRGLHRAWTTPTVGGS